MRKIVDEYELMRNIKEVVANLPSAKITDKEIRNSLISCIVSDFNREVIDAKNNFEYYKERGLTVNMIEVEGYLRGMLDSIEFMETEIISLDKYETYYLMLIKNWKNPNIESIANESNYERFRRSIVWMYHYDLENNTHLSKAHTFNILTSLAVKCLNKHSLGIVMSNYNPHNHLFEWEDKTLEECIMSMLKFLSNKNLKLDDEYANELISYDKTTLRQWKEERESYDAQC